MRQIYTTPAGVFPGNQPMSEFSGRRPAVLYNLGRKGRLFSFSFLYLQAKPMTETCSSPLSPFLNAEAWECLAQKLKLSPREVQILQVLLEDQRESEIARRLRVSPHTVHAHMDRLHGKLSVRSQVELILKILTAFLVMTAEAGSPLAPICSNRTSGRCPLNS